MIIYKPFTRLARLPFNEVKGTVIDRDKRAKDFANVAVRTLEQRLIHRDMSWADLRRLLDVFIPKKIALCVTKNYDKTSQASMNAMVESDGRVNGYIFSVNPTHGNKFSMFDLPMLAHEFLHLGDMLFHPKIIAREQRMALRGIFDDSKYDRFFDDQVYVMEYNFGKKSRKMILRDIRNKTNKFLRRRPIEDKIDILQFIRYNLMMEDRAFRFERKIAKRNCNKWLNVNEDDLYDKNSAYMFRDKIKLFSDMLADLIKKERELHGVKLKKRSMNKTSKK